jgi:mono/diheme cytochrome c family protein
MKRLQVLYIAMITALGIDSVPVAASDTLDIAGVVAEGELLFTQNCKACHHLEMRLVGPALKGVDQRHDEGWLLRFVRSSQTMIQEGDSAAVTLFNTFNKVPMPDQNLTDGQIRSILAYIKNADKPVLVASGGIPRPAATIIAGPVSPPRFSDYRFWIMYTITVVLVIVSIYYKAELIALRKRVEGETPAAG